MPRLANPDYLYRVVRAAYAHGVLDRHGMQSEIARKCGVSRQRVSQVVQVIRADPHLRASPKAPIMDATFVAKESGT